jgi:hypothetical protein
LQLEDKVLQICESLHERRLLEWPLLEFYVQYLDKWGKQNVIGRIEEFLASHPGRKLVQSRLFVIGSPEQGKPRFVMPYRMKWLLRGAG